MPWETVWSKVLTLAKEKISSLDVSWTSIQDAGPLEFTLNDVVIAGPALPGHIALNKLNVELGLTPLVTVRLVTGPTLTVQAYRSKSIRFQGALDLAELIQVENVGGVVNLTGDAAFPEWGQPPANGRLEITSQRLALPGGLQAADVAGAAELSGDNLAIREFHASEPVPLEASGSARLNWSNLKASTYQVTGSVKLGDKTHPFTRSGNLNQIPGL